MKNSRSSTISPLSLSKRIKLLLAPTILPFLAGAVAAQSTPAELGDAVDAPGLAWSTTGNASWYSQDSTTYFGSSAVKSGNIANNQQSSIELEIDGPDNLGFAWKVSSEGCCDRLKFLLDGVFQFEIRGEVDWGQRVVPIPAGSHIVSWVYTKDGSVSTGSDAGWLDQVELENGGLKDVLSLGVGKTKCFEQRLHHGDPEPSSLPWGFETIALAKSKSTVLNAASTTSPAPASTEVVLSQNEIRVSKEKRYETMPDLNTEFPDGTYSCLLDTPHDGANIVPVTLDFAGATPYPVTPPRITNLAAAQTVRAGEEFVLHWEGPSPSDTVDAVRVIVETLDNRYLVYELLDPAATSLTIPADTLADGFDHFAEVAFIRRTWELAGADNTAYPRLPVVAYAATKTEFALSTKSRLDFKRFRKLFFSDPEAQAWDSNEDGDRFTLLEEYFHGLDPAVADRPMNPEVSVEGDIISYRYDRLAAVSPTSQRILGSENLVDWEPIGGTETAADVDLNYVLPRERVDLQVLTGNRPRYFIKHGPSGFEELTPTITGIVGSDHAAGDLLTLQVDSITGVDIDKLLVWFGEIAMPATSIDLESSTISVVVPVLNGPTAISIDSGYGRGDSEYMLEAGPPSLPASVSVEEVESSLCSNLQAIEQQMRNETLSPPSGFELTAEQAAIRMALADLLESAIANIEMELASLPAEDRKLLAALLWRSGLVADLGNIDFSVGAEGPLFAPNDAGGDVTCPVDPRWETIKKKRLAILVTAKINRKFESMSLLMFVSSITGTNALITAFSMASQVMETYLSTEPVLLDVINVHAHDAAPPLYRGEPAKLCYTGSFVAPAGGEAFGNLIVKGVLEAMLRYFRLNPKPFSGDKVILETWNSIIETSYGSLLSGAPKQHFPPSQSLSDLSFDPVDGWIIVDDYMETTPLTIHYDKASNCVVGCSFSAVLSVLDLRLRDTIANQLRFRPGFAERVDFDAKLVLSLENQEPTLVAPVNPQIVVDATGSGSLVVTIEDLDQWDCGEHSGTDLDWLQASVPTYGDGSPIFGSVSVTSAGRPGASRQDYTINYVFADDGPVVPEITVTYEIPTDPTPIRNAIIPLHVVIPQEAGDQFTLNFTDSYDGGQKVITVDLSALVAEVGESVMYQFELVTAAGSIPGTFMDLAPDGTVMSSSAFVFVPEFGASDYPEFEARYRAKSGPIIGPWSRIRFKPDRILISPVGLASGQQPDLSWDGKYIAYKGGDGHIWRKDLFEADSIPVLVSSDSDNIPLSGTGSLSPSISDDGTRIAFEYIESFFDGPRIAVKNMTTGELKVLKESANAWCERPAISGSGQYVAFHSSASNIVSGDLSGTHDIFVAHIDSGNIERVSVNKAGQQTFFGGSTHPSISQDGRQIAFYTTWSGFADGLDTEVEWGNGGQIIWKDLVANEIRVVSAIRDATTLLPRLVAGSSESEMPSLSSDGRYIVFRTWAPTFADDDPLTDDASGDPDLFIWDSQVDPFELTDDVPPKYAAPITHLSRDAYDRDGSRTIQRARPQISRTGDVVAYFARRVDPDTGTLAEYADVWAGSIPPATRNNVSTDPRFAELLGEDSQIRGDGPQSIALSGDGNIIAFESWPNGIIVGNTPR